MAEVTFRYGGDTVTHAETAVHVSCDDLDANTLTGYDPDNYPASPEVTYYFSAELAGVDDARSQVFAPNGGHGEWHGWVPPTAGTWSVHVRKVADDSSVADEDLEVV
jgi:hypothetical protein